MTLRRALSTTPTRCWSGGNLPRSSLGRVALGVALLALLVGADRPELHLVGTMHENLARVNDIVEAVAREDYEAIARRARQLDESARMLADIDLDSLGLDRGRNVEFDGFLSAQQRAAEAMLRAGEARDADGVLRGVKQLFDKACLPCHREFRAQYGERTPQVLFMRTLLSAATTMNWGLAMEDYSVIAREAREISTIARVFGFAQISESMFNVTTAAEQERFRAFMVRLVDEATRVEGAAFARDAERVTEAVRTMLAEGCVPCHARFRKEH